MHLLGPLLGSVVAEAIVLGESAPIGDKVTSGATLIGLALARWSTKRSR